MKNITRRVFAEEVKYTLFNDAEETIESRTVIVPKDYSRRDRKIMESYLFPHHTVVKSETISEKEFMCSMPLSAFFDTANKHEVEETEEE